MSQEDDSLRRLREIDRLANQFEADLRDGRPQDIAEILAAHPDLGAKLFAALLGVELEFTAAAGHRVPRDAYLAKFPEFADIINACYASTPLEPSVEGTIAAEKTLAFADEDKPTLGVASEPTPFPVERYHVLSSLGAGGMGSVYLAEQQEPVRRLVALKVIKRGMDSEQVIARFEAERQALALMDHPNIARIFDAGLTSDGRPFFAMEYVQGSTITEFCNTHALDLRQRLLLFVQVCHAVQHAHHKGIIHRDLKPSNILVSQIDGVPSVKVIDFGLAKAIQGNLTKRTLQTEIGQILGTLAYMSPEQAQGNGSDIDTRTDVYSLGVILYELLTGSTPLDKDRLRNEAIDLILRWIREEEAPRPSRRISESKDSISISQSRRAAPRQLSSIFKGDLDWVAMKALEKDRNRRYSTVSGLGDDIVRYLGYEPVEARPPSFGYRFSKAARKHRKLFTTAISILAILILGLVGTITGWIRASRLADIAELRRQLDTRLVETRQPLGRMSLDDSRALLSLCDELLPLDRPLAIISRTRVMQSLMESLDVQINAPRIDEAEIQRLMNAIDELQSLNRGQESPLDPQAITAMRLHVASRLRDWRPELISPKPVDSGDANPFADQGVIINGTDFELIGEARIIPLQTNSRTPRNLQVSATFVRGLQNTNWIGLSMNESDSGSHYRFVLSTSPLSAGPAKRAALPEPQAADPSNLLTAIVSQSALYMSIVRSGEILAERSVSTASTLARLTARREGDTLTFVLNGQQTLEFDDAFPIPHTSGMGPAILWPQGVAVSEYQVQAQSLESPSSSPLERSDALFAREDYELAEPIYAQLGSQEAMYKRAVCLIRMGKDEEAKSNFESIADTAPPTLSNGRPESRWQLLALLQLLDLTYTTDSDAFRRSMDRLNALYRNELPYLLRVAPRELQDNLNNFLQKDGARWRVAIQPKGDIEALQLALDLQQARGASPVRLRATKWRLADAYRIAGDTTSASRLLDELISETFADRSTSREFAAVVSDRCWIDFVRDEPKIAETRLREYLTLHDDAELPTSMSLLLVDLARALIIQEQHLAATETMNQYFDLVTPPDVSHGEYIEACLVGGLAFQRLGNLQQSQLVWQRGLRRNWPGAVPELEDRRNAFGLRLVDAQKSIEGEAFLEPLVNELATDKLLEGFSRDINESGIPSGDIIGPVAYFLRVVTESFGSNLARSVVDHLFDFPGGASLRDQLILHQVSLKDHFHIPLVNIMLQGIRFQSFSDEQIPEELLVAGREVCQELLDLYNDQQLDPKKHFGLIVQIFLGVVSENSWKELQNVLSPRVATGIALVRAKRSRQPRPMLNFILNSEAAPPAFQQWARNKLEQLDSPSN